VVVEYKPPTSVTGVVAVVDDDGREGAQCAVRVPHGACGEMRIGSHP